MLGCSLIDEQGGAGCVVSLFSSSLFSLSFAQYSRGTPQSRGTGCDPRQYPAIEPSIHCFVKKLPLLFFSPTATKTALLTSVAGSAMSDVNEEEEIDALAEEAAEVLGGFGQGKKEVERLVTLLNLTTVYR